MKNEGLKVKMVFTPLLSDSLTYVKKLKDKPRIVVLHAGTNDLNHSEEDDMLSNIEQIHEYLNKAGIKMVYSFITPRTDSPELDAKAQVINARVCQLLGNRSDVFMSRNDNFYKRGTINVTLLDEDGIHVNDFGTKNLALNTKDSICRGLDIQSKPRDNQTYIRSNRGGRGRGRGRGH